jgi:hypothetical protein
MGDPEIASPLLRVPSRYEKWSTLLSNVFFSASSIGAMFWALDLDPRQPATWMCGYGGIFFGMNALHSWRSIKNGWNIRDDNQDFYGPMLAWTTSK